MNPVIIECAINGVTSKATNPHVPVEPSEIAADALGCIEAGAAIIHNHIDRYGVSVEQAAERYLEAWRPVLAARPDALLYPTVHFDQGSRFPTNISSRSPRPVCASGSPTPVRSTSAAPTPTAYLRDRSSTAIRSNRSGRAFDICREAKLGPSLAIYEPGFLRATLAWWRAGRLPTGSDDQALLLHRTRLPGSAFRLTPNGARA